MKLDMKTCPACGAVSFSDAEVCFGCLNQFEDTKDVCADDSDDLIAVGVVMVKRESAPEGALEITLRFDDCYAKDLARSFSACS